MEWFLRELETRETELITEDLERPAAMEFGPEEQRQYDEATVCWVCDGALSPDDAKNPTVRDHDHITGAFRGAAHQNCNVKLRICAHTHRIPVIFHNLKGYDGHHIISEIGKTKTDIITYTDAKGKVRVS